VGSSAPPETYDTHHEANLVLPNCRAHTSLPLAQVTDATWRC
jgi:hypothetical protein